MAHDPLTAERVYRQLKASVLDGSVGVGRGIEIARLAGLYGTSVTPVREAVLRLVGERLLEMQPHGGFRLPLPDEHDLAQLYALNLNLMRAALKWSAKIVPGAPVDRVAPTAARDSERPAPGATAGTAAALFACLARGTGNAALVALVAGVSDRLHLARLAEAQAFATPDADLAALVAAATAGHLPLLGRTLRHYHRRRIAHAGELAFAIYRIATAAEAGARR